MSRLEWPAADRNKDHILSVLREALPATGLVLEVASGPGQHAAWFASHLPAVQWQPTDPKPAHLDSIRAWREHVDAPNLLPPARLDVLEPWPVQHAAAVVNINMIHVAPWEATEALFAGAFAVLPEGAPMVVYGPYLRGAKTAPSNLAFSESLQARDPSWGVRELDAVVAEAEAQGMVLDRLIEMPANNLSVLYRRGP